MTAHRCSSPRCRAPLPPGCHWSRFLCESCWVPVPAEVRAEMARHYVPGQCDDPGLVTRAYLAACRAAVRCAVAAARAGAKPAA